MDPAGPVAVADARALARAGERPQFLRYRRVILRLRCRLPRSAHRIGHVAPRRRAARRKGWYSSDGNGHTVRHEARDEGGEDAANLDTAAVPAGEFGDADHRHPRGMRHVKCQPDRDTGADCGGRRPDRRNGRAPGVGRRRDEAAPRRGGEVELPGRR